MTITSKRVLVIGLTVAFILLIPLVAMQFTNEVNWTLSDFGVAGFLLLGTGLLCELVIRQVNKRTHWVALCAALVVLLVLVWVELAVGIFGTLFAGH